jgi:hypothetical protein
MVFQNVKLDNELFSSEELIRIKHVLLNGEFSKLMNVLDEITPTKELAIQDFINQIAPINDGFDSEVRARMQKELPNGPQTPEEEAHWEEELQKEFIAHEEKVNNKRKGIVDGLAGKEVPAQNEQIDIVIEEKEIGDDEDISTGKDVKITSIQAVEEPERKTIIKEVDSVELEKAKEKMKNPGDGELDAETTDGDDDEEVGLTDTNFNKLIPKQVKKETK